MRLASLVAGPIIAGTEALSNLLCPGYDSWRTCFWVQGAMAVLCGFLLFVFQPRNIETSRFLNTSEKVVASRLALSDSDASSSSSPVSLFRTLRDPALWLFSVGWLLFQLPYWGESVRRAW